MDRRLLIILVVGLAIGVAALGYLYYQETQSGFEIQINDQGISVDGDGQR